MAPTAIRMANKSFSEFDDEVSGPFTHQALRSIADHSDAAPDHRGRLRLFSDPTATEPPPDGRAVLTAYRKPGPRQIANSIAIPFSGR